MSISASGHPYSWKALCRLQRRLNRSRADETVTEWNRAAARYRVALLFCSVSFEPPISRGCALGYSAGLRLLLAYSAHESSARASKKLGLPRPQRNRAKTSQAASRALRSCLTTHEGALRLIRSGVESHKLRKQVEQFIDGDDELLLDTVAALRHLIAHGSWTAWGGGGNEARGRRALNLAADYLIEESSLNFDDALAHLQTR
jgi:hypothetical protein